MGAAPGLRERKKQRTREAIVEAAFRLFAERGFDGTTVADIADAADISPRTFFSYFPTKDDVVFHDYEESYAMVESWLRDREPGANTFDALRAGMAAAGGKIDPAGLREKRLRGRLIRENDSLAAYSDHLKSRYVELLGQAVADDLGDAPADLRPRLVAAAMAAAIDVIEEMPADDADQAVQTLESLLAFLRGGLAALQEQGRS